MSNKFTVTWEAEDGYVGRSRPHSLPIYDDLCGDETDDDLENMLFEAVDEHFQQTVSYFIKNKDEATAWLRSQRDSIRKTED